MKFGLILLFGQLLVDVKCQNVFGEHLTPLLKITRLFAADLIKPRTFEGGYKISLKNNRVQREYTNQSFFCDVNGPGRRSADVPSSVHRLRPGDIDIVGAIGDSLTAANGAFSINELQIALEGRGVAWSIGGKGNWRQFVTLPNLLKEFNPNLYGFPEEPNSLGFEKTSKFNVAEPGAIVGHTIRQAQNLVKRMRSDRNVDIKKHWKVITIMVGSNDFCLDICYFEDQNSLLAQARRDMIRVLRILRENLPRTLVNLVVPVDVTAIFTFKNIPGECLGLQYLQCPCLKSPTQHTKYGRTLETIRKWKVMVKEVADLPEFHNRNDFEVSLMRFTETVDITGPDGNSDLTYMAKDCFHLSQKGHKLFAQYLWNAMMTTETERPLSLNVIDQIELKCPTSEYPYFRTRGN